MPVVMMSVIEACTSLNENISKIIIPKDIKQNRIYVCLVFFTLFFFSSKNLSQNAGNDDNRRQLLWPITVGHEKKILKHFPIYLHFKL